MSTALLASWSRIDAWLAARAPRTRATLQAPVEAERLRRTLGESGRAVAVEDDEVRTLAESLDAFLQRIATKLEDGTVTIDERLEERELHEVLFDARKARKVGDLARHSVFDALGIVATVEDVAQVFGPFDTKPPEVFGLAVRLELVAGVEGTEDFSIESVTLCDANDRPCAPPPATASGAACLRGRLAYVWDTRPLPEGARLKVTLARVRRG